MSDYIPLALPTVPTTQNFTAAAQWLEEASSALAVSSDSFLSALADLKDIDFSQVGDLPTFTSATFITDFSQIGTRPTRGTIDTDFNTLLDRLNSLVAPTAPTATFSYTDPGYSSSLRDPLIAKILYDLINGGYGIDDTDETRLWNRERDREAQLAQANIEELRRVAASTAFTMPQGALFAQLQKARQDYMAKIAGASRDIALKRADLYVENRKFTIEKALASESQSIDLYNAVQNRTLDLAKANIQMTIALFEAASRVFELELNAVLKQLTAKIDAAKMQVELYHTDVLAYAAYVNAIATQAHVAIEDAKLTVDRDKTQYQARVEIIRFRLQQLAMTIEKQKDINKFGVEFFRTGLGSSMSGINGLAVQSGTV